MCRTKTPSSAAGRIAPRWGHAKARAAKKPTHERPPAMPNAQAAADDLRHDLGRPALDRLDARVRECPRDGGTPACQAHLSLGGVSVGHRGLLNGQLVLQVRLDGPVDRHSHLWLRRWGARLPRGAQPPRLATMAQAPTSLTHWGAFTADMRAGDIAAVTPFATDLDPSPLLGNLPGSVRHRSRVATPAIRRGWLRDGPGPSSQRGAERLRRGVLGRTGGSTRRRASPRRRHPRQRGDLRRLLRLGQRRAVPSRPESSASLLENAWRLYLFQELLQPRRNGRHHAAGARHTRRPFQAIHGVGRHRRAHRPVGVLRWRRLEEHRHQPRWHHRTSRPRRIAPLPRPRWADRVLLPAARRRRRRLRRGSHRCPAPTSRSCWHSRTCWPPKVWPTAHSSTPTAPATTASSATCSAPTTACRSRRSGLGDLRAAADELTALARRMAARRTLVTVSWSLQRIRHGEQAPWMGLTLAAMLGQIGLPGGGFGHGYGSMNEPGLPPLRCRLPSLPQGANPVRTFIPVAASQRHAAASGRSVRLQRPAPDLPRHQAGLLGRRQPVPPPPEHSPAAAALARPDTIVVHDPYWTADGQARRHRRAVHHSFERDDYSGIPQRPAADCDAGARRVLRACPRRLRRRSPRWPPAGIRRAVHRRAQRTASGSSHLYEQWSR